jgi:hypothetical protein
MKHCYRDEEDSAPRASKTCAGCATPSEFCPESGFQDDWSGDDYDGDSDDRDDD